MRIREQNRSLQLLPSIFKNYYFFSFDLKIRLHYTKNGDNVEAKLPTGAFYID